MRRTGTVLLSFAATIASTIFGAQASSFIMPEQAKATPSVISIGSPQAVAAAPQAENGSAPDVAVAPAVRGSQSVLMLGAPLVTDEKVASIAEKRSGRSGSGPLVIRGGIPGGASSSTPAPAVSAASAAAPQETKTPLPPNGEQGPKNLREAVEATR